MAMLGCVALKEHSNSETRGGVGQYIGFFFFPDIVISIQIYQAWVFYCIIVE